MLSDQEMIAVWFAFWITVGLVMWMHWRITNLHVDIIRLREDLKQILPEPEKEKVEDDISMEEYLAMGTELFGSPFPGLHSGDVDVEQLKRIGQSNPFLSDDIMERIRAMKNRGEQGDSSLPSSGEEGAEPGRG